MDSDDPTQIIKFLTFCVLVVLDILFFLCALQFVCTVPTIEDLCQPNLQDVHIFKFPINPNYDQNLNQK